MASPGAMRLYEFIRTTPKQWTWTCSTSERPGSRQKDMTSEPKDARYEETLEVDGLRATPGTSAGEAALITQLLLFFLTFQARLVSKKTLTYSLSPSTSGRRTGPVAMAGVCWRSGVGLVINKVGHRPPSFPSYPKQ